MPVSQVPRFIEVAGRLGRDRTCRRGCSCAYGHLGDGNLHFNINQRAGSAGRPVAWRSSPRRSARSTISCKDFGGSFSAEHGIGQLKVFELERYANPVELELMHRVKQAFDPNGIMNPGKVLKRP